MVFEFIHFPDFKNGFFGKDYCSSLIASFIAARQRLSCKHISHITPRPADVLTEGADPVTVVTTAPSDWINHYSAKDYFKIDPLFQPGWAEAGSQNGVTIREIYAAQQATAELQQLSDELRSYRLGNCFIAVSHSLSCHEYAHTIFSFDGNNGLQPAELIRLLEKDLKDVAALLHEAVLAEIGNFHVQKKEVQSLVSLTPRELDCLKWAARGKTDGEIAEILNIARWTVVTYLQNAKIKLGCANRTSAVAVAMSLGIIPMPDISHLQK